MKPLNDLKFISEATKEIERYEYEIEKSEDFEKAKGLAKQVIGYTGCMVTYLNCMICEENNEFTDNLDQLTDEWLASIYGCLAEKAISTEQDDECITKLLKRRDEIREYWKTEE